MFCTWKRQCLPAITHQQIQGVFYEASYEWSPFDSLGLIFVNFHEFQWASLPLILRQSCLLNKWIDILYTIWNTITHQNFNLVSLLFSEKERNTFVERKNNVILIPSNGEMWNFISFHSLSWTKLNRCVLPVHHSWFTVLQSNIVK